MSNLKNLFNDAVKVVGEGVPPILYFMLELRYLEEKHILKSELFITGANQFIAKLAISFSSFDEVDNDFEDFDLNGFIIHYVNIDFELKDSGKADGSNTNSLEIEILNIEISGVVDSHIGYAHYPSDRNYMTLKEGIETHSDGFEVDLEKYQHYVEQYFTDVTSVDIYKNHIREKFIQIPETQQT